MSLGLFRGKVTLEPHSTEWETTAQQTIAELREILKGTVTDAQHIGSTSIKTICAKPIIDLVVGVSDFEKIFAKNDILEANGFFFRGQDHPEQYLYICGEGNFITHHIHVVRYGSDTWHNYIHMRDYLNSHSEDAQAYAELKQKLAQQYPDDRNTYTNMKSEFISDILSKAQKWRNS